MPKKFQTEKISFFWQKLIWFYYTKKNRLYKNGCYVILLTLSQAKMVKHANQVYHLENLGTL